MLVVNNGETPSPSTGNNQRPIKYVPTHSHSPMKMCDLSASTSASTSFAPAKSTHFSSETLEGIYKPNAVPPLYSMSDLDVLGSLGEGFFSKVFKVRHRATGELMVLKVTKPSAVGGTSKPFSEVAKEASMMSRISHENVIKFWGICIQTDSDDNKWDMHLLLAYCDHGSLSKVIRDQNRPFVWRHRVAYAEDVASAMEYVHNLGIMHRDLTSMNVLLQSVPSFQSNGTPQPPLCSSPAAHRIRAVVADFGLACEIPKKGEKLMQVGTTYYMSPECLNEGFYNEKSDVFSFGIIACQLIARIDADPDSGLYRTSNFGLDYMKFTPQCPADTPIDLLRLALQCCMLDPSSRPSFSEIRAALREIRISLPSTLQ